MRQSWTKQAQLSPCLNRWQAAPATAGAPSWVPFEGGLGGWRSTSPPSPTRAMRSAPRVDSAFPFDPQDEVDQLQLALGMHLLRGPAFETIQVRPPQLSRVAEWDRTHHVHAAYSQMTFPALRDRNNATRSWGPTCQQGSRDSTSRTDMSPRRWASMTSGSSGTGIQSRQSEMRLSSS